MATGPQLSEQEAYVLRAAAIDACEIIVRMAKDVDDGEEGGWIKSLTLPELDGWLWSVAKAGRLRNDLSRFRQRGPCHGYQKRGVKKGAGWAFEQGGCACQGRLEVAIAAAGKECSVELVETAKSAAQSELRRGSVKPGRTVLGMKVPLRDSRWLLHGEESMILGPFVLFLSI
ncbi:hypothetical protein FRC17_008860 [Serendipita sp. 399]|nr:hypothetical protein FRC17_008860 [Serendipita sp. 399]